MRKTIDNNVSGEYNNSAIFFGNLDVDKYNYDVLGNPETLYYVNGDIEISKTIKDALGRPIQSKIKTDYWQEVNTVTQYENFASNVVQSEQVAILRAEYEGEENYWVFGKYDVTYERDLLERPTKTTVLDQNNNGYSTTYEYYDHLDENNDKVGTTPFIKSVTHKTVANGVESSPQVALVEYDSAGNITKYGNNEYAYDNLNRLVTEHNADLNKSYIYEYNAGGNLTAKKEYSYNNLLSAPLNQTSFIYNFGTWKDQLSRVTVGSESAKALTYDELGNVKTYGNKSFTWGRGNKLMVVKNNNQTVASYIYSISGQRSVKHVSGTRIETKYVGNKLITHYDRTNQLHFLYNSNNEILGFRHYDGHSATMYTYRKNIFGDIVAIYLGNTCVAKYVYDAWGNHKVLNANGTQNTDLSSIGHINPIRYRGYYYDAETQLYWVSSRYYSPELCRWISPDDIEYLDPESVNGLNLYCYCLNNPINYIDPSGHSPEWWQWLINGATTALGIALCFVPGGQVFGAGLIVSGVSGLVANTMDAMGLDSELAMKIQSGLNVIGGIGLSFVPGLGALGASMIGAGVLSFAGGYISEALGGSYALGWGIGNVVGSIAGGMVYKGIVNKISTPSNMIKSFENHPNRWKFTGSEISDATGRSYRGGISNYSHYRNIWTRAQMGTHTITVNDIIKHFHYFF